MRNIQDLMESEAFQKRMQKLPPELRQSFLRHLEDLFQQESSSMLEFIADSRRLLADTAGEIRGEQEALQATHRKLAESRASDCADLRRSKSRQAQGRDDHRLYSSVSASRSCPPRRYGGARTPEPLKQPTHPLPQSMLPPLTASACAVRYESEGPSYARSPSNMYGDFDEDDDVELDEEYKEETEEIMRGMRGLSAKVESERTRQAARVAAMKEKRRDLADKRQGMAQELLREASNLEQKKLEDRERQEMLVREKLREKKRRKQEEAAAAGDDRADPVDLEASIGSSASGGGGGGKDEATINDEVKDDKKKKKKKKKDKDEGEEGDKDKKKKKKKKDKEDAIVTEC